MIHRVAADQGHTHMQWQTDAEISPNIARTAEGYLALRSVPVARTGSQVYAEHEVPGVRGDARGMVLVQRDAAEVFAPASVASYIGKPVTLGHPYEPVTRDNWQRYAMGYVTDPRRDGDLLRADLLLTRGDAIDAVLAGTRGVSVGYDASYRQQAPGYATQHGIVANHIAIVPDPRCGAACTIQDSASRTKGKAMRITRDLINNPQGDPYDRALNSHWANIETDDPQGGVGGELVMRLPGALSSYYLASDRDGNPALFRYPLPPFDPGQGSMGRVPGDPRLPATTRDRSFYGGLQQWSNGQRERGRAAQGAQLKSVNQRNREAWAKHGW
jgi:hypothetical protein